MTTLFQAEFTCADVEVNVRTEPPQILLEVSTETPGAILTALHLAVTDYCHENEGCHSRRIGGTVYLTAPGVEGLTREQFDAIVESIQESLIRRIGESAARQPVAPPKDTEYRITVEGYPVFLILSTTPTGGQIAIHPPNYAPESFSLLLALKAHLWSVAMGEKHAALGITSARENGTLRCNTVPGHTFTADLIGGLCMALKNRLPEEEAGKAASAPMPIPEPTGPMRTGDKQGEEAERMAPAGD